MKLQYVLYAVVEDERILIGSFDDELEPPEVDEIILRWMESEFQYDYALVEKQYHRE